MCRHLIVIGLIVGFVGASEVKAEEFFVKSHTSIARHIAGANRYHGFKRFVLDQVWRGRAEGSECGLVSDMQTKRVIEVMWYNGRFGAVGDTLGFKENWMQYCN